MRNKQHIIPWTLLVGLSVGLLVTGTGCPPQPQCTVDADCGEGFACVGGFCVAAGCTADADCDDGAFCNGEETCVDGACVDGENPCLADQTCDEDADECVDQEIEELYANMLEEFFPHDTHSATFACTMCHHQDPPAGFQNCDVCHNPDEGAFNDDLGMFVPKLKEAMHTADGADGKTGCRNCHTDSTEDGLWNCSFCHQRLND